jgi:hypothetical protein
MTTKAIKKPSEIGLVMNIDMLPFEIIKDCLNAFSISGVRINDMRRGPVSNSNLRRIYPRTPNAIKKYILKASLERL